MQAHRVAAHIRAACKHRACVERTLESFAAFGAFDSDSRKVKPHNNKIAALSIAPVEHTNIDLFLEEKLCHGSQSN